MELPYQPISEAEAEELCPDLAQVARSLGDSALCSRIEHSYGKKGAAAAAGLMSDIQSLPDGCVC